MTIRESGEERGRYKLCVRETCRRSERRKSEDVMKVGRYTKEEK